MAIFGFVFQNLGSMMEYILAKEYKDRLNIISDIHSESRKKELRISDEEEDFLDEGSFNMSKYANTNNSHA
jgi:hypothetical protein